jgi:ribosome-associated protein
MAKKKEATTKTTSSPEKKKLAVKKTSVKKATVKKTAIKKAPAKKAAPVKKTTTAEKVTAKTITKNLQANRTKEAKTIALNKTGVQLLVDAAVEGVSEVKAKNITVLDLRKLKNRVCDFYIVCNADSKTQVNAIAGSVEVMVKKLTGERPYHIEGMQNAEWVLIDYVNVVVHVFQTEARYFYNLEALWADAEVTKIALD